jgi:hypothetical protein
MANAIPLLFADPRSAKFRTKPVIEKLFVSLQTKNYKKAPKKSYGI